MVGPLLVQSYDTRMVWVRRVGHLISDLWFLLWFVTKIHGPSGTLRPEKKIVSTQTQPIL